MMESKRRATYCFGKSSSKILDNSPDFQPLAFAMLVHAPIMQCEVMGSLFVDA